MEFIPSKLQPRTVLVMDEGVTFEIGFDVIQDGCPKCRGTWMKHLPEDITPEPEDQSRDCCEYVEPRVRESCDCGRGIVPGAGPLVVATIFQMQGTVSPVLVVIKP